MACETSKRTSFTDIHVNIALGFVLKNIMRIDDLTQFFKKYNNEINELKYQLMHRHTNQEMIGLFLQLIAKSEGIDCNNI